VLVGKVTGAVCLHTPVAFLVAGVVALVCAFTCAEFAAPYPEHECRAVEALLRPRCVDAALAA